MKTNNLEMKSLKIVDQIDWDKVDGLIPAIIQSVIDKEVLMLGFMNPEAIQQTVQEGKVCFYSRTKQRLWVKGETSGHFLQVHDIQLDCDRDTLLIKVKPQGSVCHNGNSTCFSKTFTKQLEGIIQNRKKEKDQSSYVHLLVEKGAAAIAQKIGEEGVEVALASQMGDKEQILEESADLFFHFLVNLNFHDLSFNDVERVLTKRHKEKNGIYKENS